MKFSTVPAERAGDLQPTEAPAGDASPREAHAPASLMAGVILVCALVMIATLMTATNRHWLGLSFGIGEGGTVMVRAIADGGPDAVPAGAEVTRLFVPEAGLFVVPVETDLIQEPDFFESYDDFDTFMARQDRLARILAADRVGIELGDGSTVVVTPARSRPLSSLPADFWIQFVTGVAALLISGWIFAVRPRDAAPRIFFASGFAMVLSAHAAAIYSTRELALPAGLFQTLSLFNFLGALGFGGAAIALFLRFPRRLVSAPALAWVPLLIILAVASERLRLIDNQNTARYLPMAIEMGLILCCVAIQWWATRRAAADRAALRWLGLTITIGAGAFILIIAAPLLAGVEPPMSQGYAFGFFLLIYVGLALGLRRYRLFATGEWSFRVLYFAGASVALLLLDAAFLYVVDLEPKPAMGLALIAVCFAYLPFRDAIWRRTAGRPRMAESDLFRAVVGVAFDPSAAERAARWQSLLRELFDPLEIAPAGVPVTRARLVEEGGALRLPATADAPAYVLRYPHAGRALFSPSDLGLARQLSQFMSHADASRDAHERGALEERRRISRDLHDDVGARLLSALQQPDADGMRKLLRDAISDVRSIARALAGDRQPLATVVADLRHETAERLAAAGLALDWPLAIDGRLDAETVDHRVHRHFVSALREAVSNVIRHAGACRVSIGVSVVDGRLEVSVADDGVGVSGPIGGGNGLRNIEERVGQVGGRVHYPPVERGFVVAFEMPLRPVARS
ncbi:sensor histidine kinase [Zavarzinia compransoris]|uniref:sensor histidine kinase n=1 Tax=Zavarzinia marina TaxID=2911065 RepID=UPI001F4580D1|nr:ATP-binding protein [Zavarzinia marina]MCF4165108.1 sensor histidine kinase [Zavarzinia marina]